MKQRSALATTMHLRDNLRAVFNHTDGCGSPKTHLGEHRRASGFFMFVSRQSCAFSMVGHGGEPSGCRFQDAGLANPATRQPPRLQAGRWLSDYLGVHTMKCPAFSPVAEVTL